MALSAAEELRILAIEKKLNELQTAMNNLVSKRQMKALANVRQADIEDLKTRVKALESQVAALQ